MVKDIIVVNGSGDPEPRIELDRGDYRLIVPVGARLGGYPSTTARFEDWSAVLDAEVRYWTSQITPDKGFFINNRKYERF